MKNISLWILFLPLLMLSSSLAAPPTKDKAPLQKETVSPKKKATPLNKYLGYFVQNTSIYCDLEVFDKNGKSLGEIKKNNLWDPYGNIYVNYTDFPITVSHRSVAGGWCADIKPTVPLSPNCYSVSSSFSYITVSTVSCEY